MTQKTGKRIVAYTCSLLLAGCGSGPFIFTAFDVHLEAPALLVSLVDGQRFSGSIIVKISATTREHTLDLAAIKSSASFSLLSADRVIPLTLELPETPYSGHSVRVTLHLTDIAGLQNAQRFQLKAHRIFGDEIIIVHQPVTLQNDIGGLANVIPLSGQSESGLLVSVNERIVFVKAETLAGAGGTVFPVAENADTVLGSQIYFVARNDFNNDQLPEWALIHDDVKGDRVVSIQFQDGAAVIRQVSGYAFEGMISIPDTNDDQIRDIIVYATAVSDEVPTEHATWLLYGGHPWLKAGGKLDLQRLEATGQGRKLEADPFWASGWIPDWASRRLNFNADAFDDFIVHGDDDIQIYLGNASSHHAIDEPANLNSKLESFTVTGFPANVVSASAYPLGDLNGDGMQEIVILLQRQEPTPEEPDICVIVYGRRQIATVSLYDTDGSFYMNDSSYSLLLPPPLKLTGTSHTGDLNQDGYVDFTILSRIIYGSAIGVHYLDAVDGSKDNHFDMTDLSGTLP